MLPVVIMGASTLVRQSISQVPLMPHTMLGDVMHVPAQSTSQAPVPIEGVQFEAIGPPQVPVVPVVVACVVVDPVNFVPDEVPAPPVSFTPLRPERN